MPGTECVHRRNILASRRAGSGMLTVGELAARMGAKVDLGVSRSLISAVSAPAFAATSDLTFRVSNAGPSRSILASNAAAILTATGNGDVRDFVVADVLYALTRVTAWLPVRRSHSVEGIENRHAIHSSAKISNLATIGRGVVIGEATIIDTGAVVGDGVSIGAYCHVGPHTVVNGFATIGNRVSIGSGCSIGEDGFAFVSDGMRWLRVPCFGSVTIGDDTAILSHVVIHAGVFSDTVVGSGCALDSQVLIGHDSTVGQDTAIAGQTALAGRSRVGRSCRIGGKVGIGEGVNVADGVTITAMSMVARSIECENASYSSAWPAEKSQRWWRQVSRIKKLVRYRVEAPTLPVESTD